MKTLGYLLVLLGLSLTAWVHAGEKIEIYGRYGVTALDSTSIKVKELQRALLMKEVQASLVQFHSKTRATLLIHVDKDELNSKEFALVEMTVLLQGEIEAYDCAVDFTGSAEVMSEDLNFCIKELI